MQRKNFLQLFQGYSSLSMKNSSCGGAFTGALCTLSGTFHTMRQGRPTTCAAPSREQLPSDGRAGVLLARCALPQPDALVLVKLT